MPGSNAKNTVGHKRKNKSKGGSPPKRAKISDEDVSQSLIKKLKSLPDKSPEALFKAACDWSRSYSKPCDGYSPKNVWHIAAYYGKVDVLEWLLEEDLYVTHSEDETENGDELGYIAIRISNINLLNWLLKYDIPSFKAIGPSYWELAVELRDIKVLDWLLKNNLRSFYEEVYEEESGQRICDAWYTAVKEGYIDVLNWLKKNDIPIVRTSEERYKTLWHTAVERGDLKVLNWMLQNNIPGLNIINSKGESLWHIAGRKVDIRVLRWLIGKKIPGLNTERQTFYPGSLRRIVPNSYFSPLDDLLNSCEAHNVSESIPEIIEHMVENNVKIIVGTVNTIKNLFLSENLLLTKYQKRLESLLSFENIHLLDRARELNVQVSEASSGVTQEPRPLANYLKQLKLDLNLHMPSTNLIVMRNYRSWVASSQNSYRLFSSNREDQSQSLDSHADINKTRISLTDKDMIVAKAREICLGLKKVLLEMLHKKSTSEMNRKTLINRLDSLKIKCFTKDPKQKRIKDYFKVRSPS